MFDDSIVLPYGSFDVISFEIMNGNVLVVACFDRCIFAPESEIARISLLG